MAQSYLEKRKSVDWLITEINVAKCLSSKEMYAEFDEAFDFPSSPNEGSLDVLLDFMRDLSWQKVKHFEVILSNMGKAKKNSNYNEFVRLIETIKKHWIKMSESQMDNPKVQFIVTEK